MFGGVFHRSSPKAVAASQWSSIAVVQRAFARAGVASLAIHLGQNDNLEPEVFETLNGRHKTPEVDGLLHVTIGAGVITLLDIALV
jgi:hypothetical protein